MKYLTNNNQAGFSLVETLVAISILLIVITGPLKISTTTARSASFSSEQVTAFFLAQEGLELAQKARDDLMLLHYDGSKPKPWEDFTQTDNSGAYRICFNSIPGCGLDLIKDSSEGKLATPKNCTSITNCALYYDPDDGRASYSHTSVAENPSNGAGKTKFTRVIKMTSNGNEVLVVSTVTWRTGSQRAEQRAVAQTYLLNVYDRP